MSENRVPAVDAAIEILKLLARTPHLSVKEISEEISGTRSTTYRILNSLENGTLIARSEQNTYQLGAGLRRFAQSVKLDMDVVAAAQGEIEDMAQELGFTVKLSAIDGEDAVVLAVAMGSNPYAIHTQPGRRFPLHAGAASKVLLAFAPQPLQDAILSHDLVALTGTTRTDARSLASELEDIRDRKWGNDHGEHAEGVHAIAVPIFDAGNRCVAAISVPHFEGQEAIAMEKILPRLKQCGQKISHLLGN